MRIDLSRRVRALVGPVALLPLAAPACLAVAACTNEATPHPASLGGCSGSYDASCSIFTGGGAGGGGADSGPGSDAGDVEVVDSAAPEDGATCGIPDPQLAARAPFCAACVVAIQNDGAPSCCAVDTACSNDQGCIAILECMLTCTSAGGCPQQCGGLAPPQSVPTYNALAQCAQASCSPICPVLLPVLPGDQ